MTQEPLAGVSASEAQRAAIVAGLAARGDGVPPRMLDPDVPVWLRPYGLAPPTRDEYGACNCAGEHGAGVTWRLRVPCDALPHCSACECGDAHVVVLSEQDVANLRELLA